MPGMTVTDHRIAGKAAFIIDRAFEQAPMRELTRTVERLPFVKCEAATPDTREHLHWVANLKLDGRVVTSLRPVAESAARFFFPESRQMFRAYVNHAGVDDVLLAHTDCPPHLRVVTALLFVCDRWERDWGGEFVLFDEDEVALAVLPRPGRLVVFDGRIEHAGRPPSRICPMGRYTMAFKWMAPVPVESKEKSHALA